MENSERIFTGVWIPKDIYLNTEAKWITKVLFLEIHSFTANGKPCFFSNNYISNFLGVSDRQVSRLISDLKKLGWITETHFDGRKRYLKSNLEINFQTGEAALTKLSKPERHKNPSSLDKNVYHNIPINKSIDFSFEENNLDTPKNKRGLPLN
jgi:DNA-binding transcriptional ArsR family regulator